MRFLSSNFIFGRRLRRMLPILLLAWVAGCSPAVGPSNTQPITPVPASDIRGNVTVWSWNIAAKSLTELTPAFERQYPGAKINVEMNGTNIQARLLLSLAAGVGAPDVTQFQFYEAPHYIATKTLADLTPVASKYENLFPKAVWQNCVMNGHIYAIPWDLGPCALYYHRNIFQRYGIDPDKIETWDDYIAAGKVILAKSGGHTRMLSLSPNDLESLFEVVLQQTGGQVFDSQGQIAIDSPQAMRALDVIRKLRAAGICSDVPAYGQEWMSGFNDDTIASYPGAVWLGGLMKDTVGNKPTDWAVTKLPAVDHGGIRVADWGGSVLCIPDQSKNKAAAWAFIEYALCTREGQLAQYKNESLFPAYLPALKTKTLDEPDRFFGGQPVGRLFATGVDKIPALNRTPNWVEAVGYLQQDLSHWAATGMTDNSVLNEVATKLSRRLDVPIAPKSERIATAGGRS
jgi:lactose/L-arabinose transport system substrate-binding protein